MAKPDGVIVRGDVVKRNRHKKVLNHNYLPLLTQGTPSFIKKGDGLRPKSLRHIPNTAERNDVYLLTYSTQADAQPVAQSPLEPYVL